MLNKVILMGRLTAIPEHKQTPSGTAVTSFSIAVERNYAAKGEERGVDFINIVAWRQTADFICKYFDKGQMIAIEGCIQARNYEDKQGNKRTAVEVVADHVYFADSKNSGQNSSKPDIMPERQGGFSVGDFEEVDGDEFPF